MLSCMKIFILKINCMDIEAQMTHQQVTRVASVLAPSAVVAAFYQVIVFTALSLLANKTLEYSCCIGETNAITLPGRRVLSFSQTKRNNGYRCEFFVGLFLLTKVSPPVAAGGVQTTGSMHSAEPCAGLASSLIVCVHASSLHSRYVMWGNMLT